MIMHSIIQFVRALIWPVMRPLCYPYHAIKCQNEQDFWKLAARVGLPRWRFFRKPLSVAEVDARLRQTPFRDPWIELKATLAPDDEIWPFEFNRMTSAYRRGIVVLRNGEGVGGIVIELS